MNNNTLELTLADGNAWAVRVFDKPEDAANIKSFLLRRNGNLFLNAVANGGMEPKLYFAEVPAQD
jgi:hypothetical protein